MGWAGDAAGKGFPDYNEGVAGCLHCDYIVVPKIFNK